MSWLAIMYKQYVLPFVQDVAVWICVVWLSVACTASTEKCLYLSYWRVCATQVSWKLFSGLVVFLIVGWVVFNFLPEWLSLKIYFLQLCAMQVLFFSCCLLLYPRMACKNTSSSLTASIHLIHLLLEVLWFLSNLLVLHIRCFVFNYAQCFINLIVYNLLSL